MSPNSFPPILHGPIFPVTPVVHLTGVNLNWNVKVTGTVSGQLADFPYVHPETPPFDQWITLSALPKESEILQVEQYTVDAGQVISSARGLDAVAVSVLPLPIDPFGFLAAPIVISPVHTCSSFIGLDGIIPGAWVDVEIENGPSLVHQQARHGVQDSFDLDESVPLPKGAMLNVWQSVIGNDTKTNLDSHKTKSGPIADLGLTQPLKPVSYYPQEPRTCYNEVSISNMIAGSILHVVAPNNDQSFEANVFDNEKYDFQGWFPQPIGSGPPGYLLADQSLPRCGLSSGKAESALLFETTTLPTPKLVTPICEDQERINLESLVPGALLTIVRLVGAKSGTPTNAGDPSQTRIQSLFATATSVDIPDNWSLDDPNGEVSFQISQADVSDCRLESDPSDPLFVVASTDTNGTQLSTLNLSPDPAFVCSTFLFVKGLTIGAELQVFETDGSALLPDWVPVVGTSMVVTLSERLTLLQKGNGIHASQRGCTAVQASNTVQVETYPKVVLPDPTFPIPPRPSDKYIYAENLVPGASAYALVDGSIYDQTGSLWSTEQPVIYEKQNIDLQLLLQWKSSVSVVQTLCDVSNSSSVNLPGAFVDKATIDLSVDPPTPLVKGATTAFVIHCKDEGTGYIDHENTWGAVTIEGIPGSCYCGSCLHSLSIGKDYPRSSIKVSIAETDINYAASYDIPLAEAPPPPPTTFHLKLTGGPATFPTNSEADFTYTQTANVTAVKWVAKPGWAPSITLMPGALSDEIYTAVKIFNNPPTGAAGSGQFIEITGSADFTVTMNGQNTAQFTAKLSGEFQVDPSSVPETICIGWLMNFHYKDSGFPGNPQFVWDKGQSDANPSIVPVLQPEGFEC